MKVLFYTNTARSFEGALIGSLYGVAQKFPVVLLSEKLNQHTTDYLNDKKIFPMIEKIILVDQYSPKSKNLILNLLLNNKRLFLLAKSVIDDCRPDVVVVENDFTLFEMYLLRFAKKISAKTICLQSGIRFKTNKISQWVYLKGAKKNFPIFMPDLWKIALEKTRRLIGHIFYYWVLPITLLQKPFLGKSSVILWRWVSGLRDADYSVVFSKRDYDISLESGVKPEKLLIMNHPIASEEGIEFFKNFYGEAELKRNKEEKVLLIGLPNKASAVQGDGTIISSDIVRNREIKVIEKISNNLKGYKIFVKPHPEISDLEEVSKKIKNISKEIKILNHKEVIDKYIGQADLIIMLSPSTALYTASLYRPQKNVLSLNFYNTFFENLYDDIGGIEHIRNEEELLEVFNRIRNNNYHKMTEKEEVVLKGELKNVIELLIYFLNNK